MIMSRDRKVYQACIHIAMSLVVLIMVLPMVLLVMSSLTDESTLIVNGYAFFPAKFSLGAYQYIMTNATTIFRAYGITILVTVVGTVGCLLLTTLMSFPLSLRDLPGRNVISFFVFFTMLFSGGLVPSYIMWTNIFGIKNTIWAYIMPNYLLSAYNIILMRTFFSVTIPQDLYEAAKIDGASYVTIYLKMVLPLGKPIMVTIALFAGLTYWNDWVNGLYYITRSEMLSIQALLNKMILDIQALLANSSADSASLMRIPQISVRMAIAVVTVLPILAVYPFLQRYFASGIMMGAVKG